MQEPAREPSMEDILASIKKVIAEEKELRAAAPPSAAGYGEEEDDVLELDEMVDAERPVPADLGPPLISDIAADASRQALAELSTVAASAPPPPAVNPLEAIIREMLRPILKQWLDDNLPAIVDEHVRREISRITGASL